MLQRWLDIQRRLPGSARGYISGTPHTTSDNASPTQLKGRVSYIVDTRNGLEITSATLRDPLFVMDHDV
jgi:tRNA U34 2-thiouridine synthase MnmA/TrmU